MSSSLILKRASASRPCGEWSDDDYDVLSDGAVVGRIMNAAAAPVGEPWLWTYGFDPRERRNLTDTDMTILRVSSDKNQWYPSGGSYRRNVSLDSSDRVQAEDPMVPA
jgi:hypothetical protein